MHGSLTDDQVRTAVQEALDALPEEMASRLGNGGFMNWATASRYELSDSGIE